ncbi:hypothetical protein IQ07DRAFT_52000 [Pyrenochaeta sp. DS3sAY3a]|nr:hypothetical protein IQ07DRAFT_52000 [Pyrenochaeta sp. DS3sAY3a]
MKGNFKMSWRSKEIAGFEMTIQREIGFLQAALAVNSHSISMSMYPVLLRNQQKLITMLTQPASKPTVSRAPQDVTPCSNHEVSVHRQTSYTSQETVSTSSTLRFFGVTQRKVVKYLNYQQNDNARGTSRHKQDIISEMNELCWVSTLLGCGLTWTCKSSYGTIAPSISVYPIVSEFPETYQDLMEEDIGELQQKISSGIIHPYVREADEFSLLHLAASYHRSDICHLLLDCGVPLSRSESVPSPLDHALSRPWSPPAENAIITLRCLMQNLDTVSPYHIKIWDFESFNWLWCQTENELLDDVAFNLQHGLIRSVCISLSGDQLMMNSEELMAASRGFRGFRAKEELIHDIEAGECLLLFDIFCFGMESAFTSYSAGEKILDFLTQLGVDIELWVSNELKQFPYNVINDKRVTFESDSEGGLKLGFEWALDEGEPGFLVCSEYDEMASWITSLWPDSRRLYGERELNERERARFNRRMANKARKERKRAGLKMARSKMPGSWN